MNKVPYSMYVNFFLFQELVEKIRDEGQHLERPNVKRLISRDFEISNIKITKVELFDFSIFECIFIFL